MLKIYTLLSNQSLLARYTSGEGLRISLNDLHNATYVQAWQRYESLPDHRLKNSLQCVYGDEKTYWGYLNNTFENLTDAHLEFKGQTLCAREENFGSWQDVIVEHSPLDLMAFVMSKKVMNGSDIRQFILANITHCPLPEFPAPLLDSRLDDILQCDLHVHLNGSTFADAIWESALRNPLEFRAQMMKEWKDNKETVEELFAQFSPHFGWRESATLIDIAANLRDWLARRLVTPQFCYKANSCSMREQCNMCDFFTISHKNESGECCKCATYALRKLLWLERPLQNFVLYAPPPGSYRGEHPLCTHAPSNILSFGHEFTPLQFETYFYVLIFRKLQSESDEYFARCFHYYILLKNFFRKLLVQQCSQVGFDQFQKITLTGIREYHERAYFDRLRQFEASAGHKSRIHVEGRFAPKDTLKKLAFIKHKINEGYGKYVKDCSVRLQNKKCSTMADLSLVAHFIKTKDDNRVPGCQYYNYRRKLIIQARTLIRYIDAERSGYFSVPATDCSLPSITGFDAAANELDTPPEVFAPLYRFLRFHGHTQFTFHAGEDFQHLVSGIRAVDEAVDFLQLSAGNRIGHATALGIDPKLWRVRNEEGVRILISEWLDTLVYALFALRESADFSKDVSKAAAEIPRLCSKVYGKVYSEDCLYRAWQLRHLDPLVAFFDYDTGMTDAFTANEFEMVRVAACSDREAFDLFEKYHTLPAIGCKKLSTALENSRKFRATSDSRHKKYGMTEDKHPDIKDYYVRVESNFFTDEALAFLQARVLKKLYQKNIAIESLITSNVRISFYKNYDEHHILRWLGQNKEFEGEMYPPICLGTDDPGIFETSVKNECLHLLTMLRKQGLQEHECVGIIEKLLITSRGYLFKN